MGVSLAPMWVAGALWNSTKNVGPKLGVFAAVSIGMVKHTCLLVVCSEWLPASCFKASTLAHVELPRGKVCLNLHMFTFAFAEVGQHARVRISSSIWPLASSHRTCELAPTLAHVRLHRENIDVLRNTVDRLRLKLCRVAFAAIEVVKLVRLLLRCINRSLALS